MTHRDEHPWWQRFVYEHRFTNWLMDKPWRFNYCTVYRVLRQEARHPTTGRVMMRAHGRLESAWLALKFPHVHAPWEDEE